MPWMVASTCAGGRRPRCPSSNYVSQYESFSVMIGQNSLRRVFVRDLVLWCSIGVHQYEKNETQRIRINLDLMVEEKDVAEIDDRLEHVVCYESLIESVRKVVLQEHVHLVETLVEKIANICLLDRRVRTARVSVEKLDIIKDAASVGVEIVRENPHP